ncbi:MAG: type II toxin-antitoxin system RelE/ParE family toxin [Clostridiales bacterium]|nr:type II toxin-antitoxin system RelE/ParE family toxin [Clostridiales bacterium]
MEVYKTRTFDKWFGRIKDKKTRAIIGVRIQRIAIDGNFGDYEVISKYVTELRIDYGPGYRVYLTKKGTRIVILLIGGNKSSQSRDIRKAEKMARSELVEVDA